MPDPTVGQSERRDLAVHVVARRLDRPSLYAGGPSQRSMRIAEQVVSALEANDLLSVGAEPEHTPRGRSERP